MVVVILAIAVLFVIPLYSSAATPGLRDTNIWPVVDGSTCQVSVTTSVLIGHDESLTILAASSTRAWARIQVPNGATSTTFLNLDSSTASSTVGNGLALFATTTTNGQVMLISPTFIDIGIQTNFPMTGAITAINNNGSSTILVTECGY